MKVEAGRTLLLAEGDYSDYVPGPIVRALVDFDTEKQLARYREHRGHTPGDPPRFNPSAFTQWLCAQSLIEEVAWSEWHLGSYEEWPS